MLHNMGTKASTKAENSHDGCGLLSCDLCHGFELDTEMCMAPPARPVAARFPVSAVEMPDSLESIFGRELSVY